MNIRYNSLHIFFPLLVMGAALWVIIPNFFTSEKDSDHFFAEEIIIDEEIKISSPPESHEINEQIPITTLSDLVKPMELIGPINSMLISQYGDLIAEEYFRGMNADRANNIKSASKSILSMLTGIAIEKGYLESVDQEIAGFFPEYFNSVIDSVKATITIGDLLTMRSGLASTSRNNYGPWVTSKNWIHYALDQPLTGKPGIDRNYSTGNTHLLAVALARATEMNTLDFANRYLFDPMNIRIAGWDRDPQGYYLGGNNMALYPRDMIKIGQLMMDMGVYNGEQLISGDWIKSSIEPVTGRHPGSNNYGYLWFRRMSGNFNMVYAFGNGGQYIMILPELEAVITITTQNNVSNSTRNYRRELFRKLDTEVVPRLERNARENGLI